MTEEEWSMTEAEWLQSDDSDLMTYFVAERMSLRKLRLAQVAACRRIEQDLVDYRSRHALEVCEMYADGLAFDDALTEARAQADAAYKSLPSTAVMLAQGMYESRDFSAMPILADSLQDAGCDNADILDHCRDEKGTHVRGCWVVDLVLGKE